MWGTCGTHLQQRWRAKLTGVHEKWPGVLGVPGRVQRRPGDVEPGRGAGRAMKRGLGAGRIVGV